MKEIPEDEQPTQTFNLQNLPFFTGQCKKYKIFECGNFRLLIKSDEDIMEKSPCDELDCCGEGQSKCVPLDSSLIPMFECEKGRFDEKCQ